MSVSQPPLLEYATRDLARFASALRYEDIPRGTVERIKLSVLDSLGCCMHGVTLPWTRRVERLALAEGARPVASIFGGAGKTSPALAVLVNSTAGHAFELDDIHKESIIHPGSLATPVALALAEAHRAARGHTGRDMITAMVAGYEIGARVGNAATVQLLLDGFHPQGTSGAFCAAATAAHMLGLDALQTQHAFGIAGSQAGGLMAAQEGAMVKRLHSGRAAQSGVYAALLARDGFTGIEDVLEAPYGGYLVTHSRKPNAARLTEDLGTVFEAGKTGYKPHAAVTSIHTALDALAAIMRQQKLSAGDIAAIDAGVSKPTYVHCAWEYKAQGVTAAQMNLFFGLAVTALDGRAFVEQYREERLSEPAILDVISRISARIDPDIEAMGHAFRHAARVRVTTRDGRAFSKEILHRRGSPENPLSPDDIVAKFRAITQRCLSPIRAQRTIDLVGTLENLTDLDELIAICAAPHEVSP